MNHPNHDIHAVVFDFGNVLTMPQDPGRVAEMQGLCGLDSARFTSSYARVRREYDRGKLDALSYWQHVLHGKAPRPIAGIDGDFVRRLTELDIQSWTVIREPMITWAKHLRRAGYKTAILSNMPREHALYIEDTFEWIEAFEARLFSYAIGHVKPERAIYVECLKRLGVAPEQTLFIDDIAENVAAARAIGFLAVQFEDSRKLAAALRAFPGLPIPPDETRP